MRGVLVVYRREVAGLFLAPLAWILLFLTLFYDAFFFLHYLESETAGEVNAALRLVLGGGWPFWILVLLLPPLLTMRMISEESRSGLLEFLLTAPVSDAAVVTGKALAATSFLAVLWLSVPLYGVVLQLLGAPPDWGQIATAWIGAVLVSGLFSSIGLAASALSGTPLVAAFLATVANIVILFLPLLGQSTTALPRGVVRGVLRKVDVTAHFQGSFLTGALDSAHVVFFLAWTGVFLFLTVRLVETRRWL
jgi:ABC-2 type transport system permease protein